MNVSHCPMNGSRRVLAMVHYSSALAIGYLTIWRVGAFM